MKKVLSFVLVGVIGVVALPGMVSAAEVTVCADGCDYTSLSDAVTNVEEGSTIKLNEAITLTSKVVVNKNLTIDLNGNNITMNGDQYVFEFNKTGGEFTLTDTSATAGSITNSTNRGILVTNGELTFDEITLEAVDRVIQVKPVDGDKDSKASVIMNGGTIKATGTAENVRAVKLWGNNVANNASFTLNGGVISAPVTSKDSTGVDIGNPGNGTGANLTINGGQIKAYNGVRINGNGQSGMAVLTMNGGTILAASSGILQNTKDGTENTEIYIYDGTVKANKDGNQLVNGHAVAIQHSQEGILVIGTKNTTPNITGETAIAIKEGNITIDGGMIVATGEYKDPANFRNDGTDDTGAAISITTSDEYNGGVSIAINGGLMQSERGNAFYEGIAVNGDVPAASKSYVNSIAITGGSFVSPDNMDSVAINEYTDKEVITGGTFSSDVSEYISANLSLVQDENGNYVIGETTTSTPNDETNPETSDGIIISIVALILGLAAASVCFKKLYTKTMSM